MADEKLKLPRSSYEELSKIIKAYGRTEESTTLDEIAQISGIGRTNISANNAFLLAIGVIEGARTKTVTAKGANLALALDHEISAKIAESWKVIVEENDFLNKMVQAVSVRKGMEISHLESHIAYSAGESKAKYVLTGARAVVDILLASGLVKQEGDQILTQVSKNQSIVTHQKINEISDQPINQLRTSITPSSSNRNITLHIEVRVNVGPDDLDELGDKLRNLIESLAGANFTSTIASASDQ